MFVLFFKNFINKYVNYFKIFEKKIICLFDIVYPITSDVFSNILWVFLKNKWFYNIIKNTYKIWINKYIILLLI
jgi:hypothetical protein